MISLFPFTVDPQSLPARFAVVASAAAAAATAITIASAPAVTAATATIAAAAITTTGTAIGARSSFIHSQIAAVEFLAIQLLDCRRCFLRSCHLDKAEPARPAGHAIFDN